MSVRRALIGIVVPVALVALAACGQSSTSGTAEMRVTPATATLPAETVPPTSRVVATISTTPPVPISTVAVTTAAPVTEAPTTTVADDPTAGLPVPAPAPEPRAAEAVTPLGSIEIPKIGVSKVMYEGVTLTTLDRGPGHWPGTAMPGQVGNVVVGGHRTSHDKPFRNIDKLQAGDEVVFTTNDGGRFVYTVTSTEVVTPDAIRIIDQTPERTATLFACTPPGSTSHRLVIHLALAA